MTKIKEYFSSRGAGYFLALAAIVPAALAIVFYAKNGVNIYSGEYNGKIFLCCGLAIAFAVFSLLTDFIPVSFADEFAGPARAVSFLLLLYAVMQYILSQIMFLGAVAVAIDVEQYGPLIPGFVATVLCLILAAAFAVTGACLDRRRPLAKSERKGKEGEKDT